MEVGIAVFTNTSGNPLPSILINCVHDHLGGHDPVPWLERFREMRRKALTQQKSDDAERLAARKPGTRPSHDLADFCGAYEHPAYGRMVITLEGDGLHWAWRGMSAALSHRHDDAFQLPFIGGKLNPDDLVISFATGHDGSIASLSAPLEPLVADIMFLRAPADAGLTSPRGS